MNTNASTKRSLAIGSIRVYIEGYKPNSVEPFLLCGDLDREHTLKNGRVLTCLIGNKHHDSVTEEVYSPIGEVIAVHATVRTAPL